ncbi:hypothetical protein [Polyangium aurulentum]|uniref:hypothetical protein n=1 Tax=Polyangium aurulentum TaxID=2567896 RepID=UPI0010AEA173|nr:hypothetical protein [Polyangium aurulentum]UQA56841.1 hypothetical protein E8A73_036905 [Polyangium aurulentum]
MHSYGKAARLALAAIAIVTSVASAPSAAEVDARGEDPEVVEEPEPAVPSRACVAPRALLSTETCRQYADCCFDADAEGIDPAMAGAWACSYSRAGARATCHCSIAASVDVRCESTASGARCKCM